MFLVEDLVQLCCSHLRRELSIGNSMGMYRVADHYYCPQFREKVIQYVCEHFSEITRQSEEFIHTPYEYLRSLLSMDELNVRNENYLLDVLRRWVDYNPTVRSSFLSSLFQGVRVGFCSPENLRSFVYSYPFMAQQSSCRQALYSLSQGGCCSWGRDGGPEGAMVAAGSACGHCGTWRPRMPSELMLVVGGWAETRATSVMEAYDVRANKWLICLDEDIMPRAYHGLVVLGDLLYMVGGFDGDTCFSSMQCYDLKRHVWLERSCMNLARCYVSVSTLGGHIYAAGGFTGQTRTNSVEKYFPRLNQWFVVSPMHKRRSDASSCAFNGKLYVAGGFTGTRVLSSVEVYDPAADSWTYMEPMLTARSGFRLVQYANAMYAIGGFDGSLRLNTVERYRTDLRRWETRTSMRLGRSNFAAAVLEDGIYIMGGFNGTTTVSDVECYSHHNDVWRTGAPLNISRSAFSACVLKGLGVTKQYSYCGA
ncbi:unnamed protein product, partial [Ixodes pacificus]